MSYRARALILLLATLFLGGGLGTWWYVTTRPAYRLERGRDAIRRQNWARAEALADRLEAAGEDSLARLLRGESLLAQGLPADALRELNQLRDEGAIRLEAAVLSGRCLLELKELREALRVFSWVLDQDADHVDARRGMAALHYDLGNLSHALEHLAEVARLDPRDGRPHLLTGVINGDLGRPQLAEEAFRRALECDLSDTFRSQVRLDLAACLLRLNRFQDALEQLDLRPEAGRNEDEKALAARGECLLGLNRWDELEAFLDRALIERPRQWQLLLLRGRLRLEARQPAAAVQALERAVQAAPSEYTCRYHLSLAYSAAGQAEKAAEQQKRAEALKRNLDRMTELTLSATHRPGDPAVRLEMAALCDQMQKPELAALWRRAARECQVGPSAP